MNYPLLFRNTLIAVALITAGCSKSMDSPNEYTVEQACILNTQPAPPAPDIDDPGITTPVTSITELWDAMNIDNGAEQATRVSGSMPSVDSPMTQSFAFPKQLVVSDGSVQQIPLHGAIPSGKRIGALFLQVEGINEYAILPISGSDPSITFRGPIPPAHLPDLELITSSLATAYSNGVDFTIRALLVDEGDSVDPTASSFSTAPEDWMESAWEAVDSTARPLLVPQIEGKLPLDIWTTWDNLADVRILVEPPASNGPIPTILGRDGASVDYDTTNGYISADPGRDGYGPFIIHYDADNIPEGRIVMWLDESRAVNNVLAVTACGRTIVKHVQPDVPKEAVYVFYHSDGGCELGATEDQSTPDFVEETSLCDVPSKNYVIVGEQ